jgi:U3 small nucleolar RNA-associated protein 21
MSMSHSSARAKDWDDIVTAHMDESVVRTWSMQNKKLGRHLDFSDMSDKKEGKGRPLAPVKVFH